MHVCIIYEVIVPLTLGQIMHSAETKIPKSVLNHGSKLCMMKVRDGKSKPISLTYALREYLTTRQTSSHCSESNQMTSGRIAIIFYRFYDIHLRLTPIIVKTTKHQTVQKLYRTRTHLIQMQTTRVRVPLLRSILLRAFAGCNEVHRIYNAVYHNTSQFKH